MRHIREGRDVIEVPGWVTTPDNHFREVTFNLPDNAQRILLQGNVECPPIPDGLHESWQLARLFVDAPGRTEDIVLYELALRTRHRRWIEVSFGKQEVHEIGRSVSDAGPEIGIQVAIDNLDPALRGRTLTFHFGMQSKHRDGYHNIPAGVVYQDTTLVVLAEPDITHFVPPMGGTSEVPRNPAVPEPLQQVADLGLELAEISHGLDPNGITYRVVRNVATLLPEAALVDYLGGLVHQQASQATEPVS